MQLHFGPSLLFLMSRIRWGKFKTEKMEKLFSIYVACGLKHAPEEYRNFITEFKGHLSFETGYNILDFKLDQRSSPGEVYTHDIGNQVRISDVIIADLSYPSTGEGYEMATQIEKYGKPVIGLAKAGSEVSRLILGIPGFTVDYYRDLDEMLHLAMSRLATIRKNLAQKGKLIVLDGLDGSGKRRRWQSW